MFDTFLRNEVSRLELPGLAVSVTQHGEEQFAAGFGHCDPACSKPVTADTLFGIASITKLVTAIEIMRLQEQNLLSLFDPVNQYYQGLDVASDTRIQLHHLLSHSSGLPGLPSRFFAQNLQNNKDASGGTSTNRSECTSTKPLPDATLLDATDLVDYLNGLSIAVLAPPGSVLSYSNEGFCLLGGIVEKLTAQPYSQRVQDSIFKPLGMTRSVVGTNTSHDSNIALPLQRHDAGLRTTGIWDAPLFYPAGGGLSSARDLTRLFSTLSEDCHLLSNQSRQTLCLPAISVVSRPDKSIGYGFGLEYQRIDNKTSLHWHTGQRTGISSFAAWVSGSNLSVSVLSQIADAPVAGIGFALIAKMLNRTDIIWPQLSDRLTTTNHTSDAPQLSTFQGRYGTEEGFNFQVRKTGSKLFLIDDKDTAPQLFRFFDKKSGIVGNHNFRFLASHPDSTHPEALTTTLATTSTTKSTRALALDLRILPYTHSL